MIDAAVSPLRVKQAELEARLKALEAQPLKYEGVWEQREYPVGSFVTHGGSVWYCRETASAADQPNASRCWQLAVKRGRDGKDANGHRG